jgi:hypothetical protein
MSVAVLAAETSASPACRVSRITASRAARAGRHFRLLDAERQEA